MSDCDMSDYQEGLTKGYLTRYGEDNPFDIGTDAWYGYDVAQSLKEDDWEMYSGDW